jgi:hypothetical protein
MISCKSIMKSFILSLSLKFLSSMYLAHQLRERYLRGCPSIFIFKHLLINLSNYIKIMLKNFALLNYSLRKSL